MNNGGEMVEATLRVIDANVSFRAVHASRGKRVRAEPVAALYEQGRVHHVGRLTGARRPDVRLHRRRAPRDGPSPDRVDALVWALTDLMIAPSGTGLLEYYSGLVRDRGK